MPTTPMKLDQVQLARNLIGGRDPWLLLPDYPGDSGVIGQKKWNKWDLTPVAQSLNELTKAPQGSSGASRRHGTPPGGRLCTSWWVSKLGRRNGTSGLTLEHNTDVPEVSNVLAGSVVEDTG